MLKNILIPLDGSQLAEAALPAAELLATKLNVPVTLLHVIEQNAPESVHKEHHLTKADEAETYLKELASQAFSEKTKVDFHVHSAQVKDVPQSIVEHAAEFNPDLIIMCAHGNSGIRDFLFGRIAQQVVVNGATPLLLLQPMTSEKKPFKLRRILLPLDSESRHDDSLPMAQDLAKSFDAEIYLLSVVPTFSTLHGAEAAASTVLPTTVSALLDAKEESAKQHLQEHLNDLFRSGYRTSAEVARGDPAQTIVNVAERLHADMIILSTHRHAGLSAFWERSVAPNVVRRTRIPILLIPLLADKP